jgi:hypothetical protein
MRIAVDTLLAHVEVGAVRVEAVVARADDGRILADVATEVFVYRTTRRSFLVAGC